MSRDEEVREVVGELTAMLARLRATTNELTAMIAAAEIPEEHPHVEPPA